MGMENWKRFSGGRELGRREKKEWFPAGKWAVLLALLAFLGAGRGSEEADYERSPRGVSEVIREVFPDMSAVRSSWSKVKRGLRLDGKKERTLSYLAEFLQERSSLERGAERDLTNYLSQGGSLEPVSALQIFNAASSERESMGQFGLFRIFLYYYQEHPSYSFDNLEPLFDKLFDKEVFSEISRNFSSKQLPQELALIPIVESMLNSAAVSSRGARGSWQFRESTAKDTILRHPEIRDILVFKPVENRGIEFVEEELGSSSGRGGSPENKEIDWEKTLKKVDQLVPGSRVAACFLEDLMKDKRVGGNISLAILAYNGGLVRDSDSYPRFLEENPELRLGWESFNDYIVDLFKRRDEINKDNVAENMDYIFRLMAVLERANQYFEQQEQPTRLSLTRLAGELGEQVDIFWGAYQRLGVEGSEREKVD